MFQMYYRFLSKGPSIKDVRTKSPKIDSLGSQFLEILSANCPHCLDPLPFVRAEHHKFRKIGVFLHQKVRTSASEDPFPHLSALDNPLDCGRPLLTAPNINLDVGSLVACISVLWAQSQPGFC